MKKLFAALLSSFVFYVGICLNQMHKWSPRIFYRWIAFTSYHVMGHDTILPPLKSRTYVGKNFSKTRFSFFIIKMFSTSSSGGWIHLNDRLTSHYSHRSTAAGRNIFLYDTTDKKFECLFRTRKGAVYVIIHYTPWRCVQFIRHAPKTGNVHKSKKRRNREDCTECQNWDVL